MLKLEGRTCVFAGATGNVGRDAVRILAESGMNVAMVTHDAAAAEEICRKLEGSRGGVIALGNAKGDAEVFSEAFARFGSVDVVISNIGGMDFPLPMEKLTEEALNGKLRHQVTAPFLMAQAAIPYLRNSFAGRIIFTSSIGAQDGFPGESMVDSIARGGVLSMTYCLARRLAPDNITVNCIAKGGMVNDHMPVPGKDFDVDSIKDCIPLGRLGTAGEFAALAAYIASEESSFVTGQVFNLSGGLHIG